MRSTTVLGMTAVTGSTPPADPPPAAASASVPSTSNETLCLQLGWGMQWLYQARPDVEPGTEDRSEQLPGMSELSPLERIDIEYARTQSCLDRIATALSWTSPQTPDITGIAGALARFRPGRNARPHAARSGDPVGQYRASVLDAHLRVMTSIAAAGVTLGKAYDLGRALADTARPGAEPEQLQIDFEPNRLAQLRQDLTDLASALPAHAGKAVAQSLTWWRDVVYVTDDSAVGRQRRSIVASIPTDAPVLRRSRGRAPHKIGEVSSPADPTKLLEALPRQAELWRVVLTGEKQPTDLLTADDYLDAAERAVEQGRRMAARSLLAAPIITATVFALMTAVLIAILLVIGHSDSSSGGKVAAFLVAVVGYLGSIGRAVMPRLRSAAKSVEQPLWHSALDYASANAITIPPVGLGDPWGWFKLSAILASTKAARGTAGATPGDDTAARP